MVCQRIMPSWPKLFFYSNYSREAEDRMEIDFLIAKPSITSKHNISPIEVKSTNRYTISSLENFNVFPHIIQECEKLGDYVVNVVEARMGVRQHEA